MAVDSDMAVSVNWGCLERGLRAPLKGFGVEAGLEELCGCVDELGALQFS